MAITDQQIENISTKIDQHAETVKAKILEAIELFKKQEDISQAQVSQEVVKYITDETQKAIDKFNSTTKLDDDQLKRVVRVFDKLMLHGSMIKQYVYLKADGSIAKYGDLYIAGYACIYGFGEGADSSYPNSTMSRRWVKFPLIDREISDVYSDGISIIFLSSRKRNCTIFTRGNGGSNSPIYPGIESNNGWSHYGPIGDKYFDSPVKKVVLGKVTQRPNSYKHMWNTAFFIILENGELWGFGSNRKKEIQNNSTDYIRNLTKIDIPGGGKVKDMAFGFSGLYGSCIAVVEEAGAKELYVWGLNNRGQLGLGHTNDVTTPTKIQNTGLNGKKIMGVWCLSGLNSSSDSSSSVYTTTYVSVEKADGRTTQLYGCGHNGYKQINGDGNYLTTFHLCTGASGYLEDIEDIQGHPYQSPIAARSKTKDGKGFLYVGGYLPVKMGNLGSGTVSWTKFEGWDEVEDFILYNSTNFQSYSSQKPYLLIKAKKIGATGKTWYHSGYDYVYGSGKEIKQENTEHGYLELPWSFLMHGETGIGIMVNNISSEHTGCTIYCVGANQKDIIVRGSSSSYNALMAHTLGVFLPYTDE